MPVLKVYPEDECTQCGKRKPRFMLARVLEKHTIVQNPQVEVDELMKWRTLRRPTVRAPSSPKSEMEFGILLILMTGREDIGYEPLNWVMSHHSSVPETSLARVWVILEV